VETRRWAQRHASMTAWMPRPWRENARVSHDFRAFCSKIARKPSHFPSNPARPLTTTFGRAI
jgi:hypothetical protein